MMEWVRNRDALKSGGKLRTLDITVACELKLLSLPLS